MILYDFILFYFILLLWVIFKLRLKLGCLGDSSLTWQKHMAVHSMELRCFIRSSLGALACTTSSANTVKLLAKHATVAAIYSANGNKLLLVITSILEPH
jgi:hypothetical protein